MKKKVILLLLVLFVFIIAFLVLKKVDFSLTLKQRIELAYPQLQNPKTNDFEKVNILREWVFNNVAWASNTLQVKEYIWNKEAPELFDILKDMDQKNKGGVDCSGYAYALMKLYKLFGYESYAYHYGNLDGWNDVITLVAIKYKGKEVLVAQQALFDSVITNNINEPYDFLRLLTDIKANKIDEAKIQQGKGIAHAAYCRKNDNCTYDIKDIKIEQLSPVVIKYQSKFSSHTLSNNIASFIIPRELQYSIDSDSEKRTLLFKKIKDLVLY